MLRITALVAPSDAIALASQASALPLKGRVEAKGRSRPPMPLTSFFGIIQLARSPFSDTSIR